MLIKTVFLILMIISTTSVFPVTLQNKDHQNYDIKVKGSSSTMSASISGGTVKSNICSACTIFVEGAGEIEASGSDQILIRNGKLEKN